MYAFRGGIDWITADERGLGNMPRPKKDGECISFYFDRELLERLRAYADEKGQSLTTAIERIVKKHLDEVAQSENNS